MLRKSHEPIGAADYERAPEHMKQTLSNMLESDKHLKLGQVKTQSVSFGVKKTATPLRQAKKASGRPS